MDAPGRGIRAITFGKVPENFAAEIDALKAQLQTDGDDLLLNDALVDAYRKLVRRAADKLGGVCVRLMRFVKLRARVPPSRSSGAKTGMAPPKKRPKGPPHTRCCGICLPSRKQAGT